MIVDLAIFFVKFGAVVGGIVLIGLMLQAGWGLSDPEEWF